MNLELLGFTILVGAIGIQRVNELVQSRSNEARMRERGGYEVAPEHYPIMVGLHASWFAAMLLEAWLLRKQAPDSTIYYPALAGLAIGLALRRYAMRTLGDRWSTRIFIVPKEAPIRTGLYGTLRHPNYLGVVIELASVPLLYNAWITSVVWSVANLFLLRHRIRLEEAALQQSLAPSPRSPS